MKQMNTTLKSIKATTRNRKTPPKKLESNKLKKQNPNPKNPRVQ